MAYKILLAAYRSGNIQLLNDYYNTYLKDDMWGLINVVFQDYTGRRPKSKLFPLSYAAVVSDAPTPLFRKGVKGYYIPDSFGPHAETFPPALLKNVRRKNMKYVTLSQADRLSVARFAGDDKLPIPAAAPLGVPKNAVFSDREYRQQCREALDVCEQYVLLCAPTGDPLPVDKALDDLLGAHNMVLLTTFPTEGFQNIRTLTGSLKDGLCAADMLLTHGDHLTEFLLTRRPIAFLPGTALEKTPGPILEQLAQAVPFAAQAFEGAYAFERERALRLTHQYTDTHAARRIWEMLLREHQVSERTIAEFCK